MIRYTMEGPAFGVGPLDPPILHGYAIFGSKAMDLLVAMKILGVFFLFWG